MLKNKWPCTKLIGGGGSKNRSIGQTRSLHSAVYKIQYLKKQYNVRKFKKHFDMDQHLDFHFLNRIDLDAHQILVYERARVFFYKDAYLSNI